MGVEEPLKGPDAGAGRASQLVDPAHRSVVLGDPRHHPHLARFGDKARVASAHQVFQGGPQHRDPRLVVGLGADLGDDAGTVDAG